MNLNNEHWKKVTYHPDLPRNTNWKTTKWINIISLMSHKEYTRYYSHWTLNKQYQSNVKHDYLYSFLKLICKPRITTYIRGIQDFQKGGGGHNKCKLKVSTGFLGGKVLKIWVSEMTITSILKQLSYSFNTNI